MDRLKHEEIEAEAEKNTGIINVIADTLKEISQTVSEKVDTSLSFKKVKNIPLKKRHYDSDSSLLDENDP